MRECAPHLSGVFRINKRYLRSFVLGGLVSLGLCASAFADTTTYDFSLTGSTFGSPFSGSGTITLDGSGGVYDVTAMTGTFTSTAPGALTPQVGFTGTISLPASSHDASNPDTARYPSGATLSVSGDYSGLVVGQYDNLYYTDGNAHTCLGYPSSASFDQCGLLFEVTDSSGYLYAVSILGDSGDTGITVSSLLIGKTDLSTTEIDIFDDADGSSFTLTPQSSPSVTPEPGSFALLSTGLLGIGGVVRRRIIRS